MKCKECKERIPDNVRYCPECGALVNENGGAYRSFQNCDVSDTENKKFSFPRIGTVGFPRRQRKASRLTVLSVCVIVFVLCFGAIFINSVFTDVPEWENQVAVEAPVDFSTVEEVAFSYAANIVDSDAFQSTESFRTHTLIDWGLVYRDSYINHHHENASVPATDEKECHEYAENCHRQAFEIINSRYSLGYEPYNFFLENQQTYRIDNSDADYYKDVISSYLAACGLDAQEYYDFDQIENLYCVPYYVTTENEDCDEWEDFGTIEVIVAEIYNEYYVLYDDVYIQALLDGLGVK